MHAKVLIVVIYWNNSMGLELDILLTKTCFIFCYTVKCHVFIGRWAEIQHIFLHRNLAQRIVNATCQSLTSVINVSCSLPTCIDNACCQCITHIDLEILYLARGFEKGIRIGSIPYILGREFEESTLRIIPSYP